MKKILTIVAVVVAASVAYVAIKLWPTESDVAKGMTAEEIIPGLKPFAEVSRGESSIEIPVAPIYAPLREKVSTPISTNEFTRLDLERMLKGPTVSTKDMERLQESGTVEATPEEMDTLLLKWVDSP